MKNKVWGKVAIAVLCLFILSKLVGEDTESVREVETTVTTTSEAETTVKETTAAERVGISEKELQNILKALNDYNRVGKTDYELEDIDLIRKGNDVLVDFEEYIVFMKNGDVIHLDINKSLLESCRA